MKSSFYFGNDVSLSRKNSNEHRTKLSRRFVCRFSTTHKMSTSLTDLDLCRVLQVQQHLWFCSYGREKMFANFRCSEQISRDATRWNISLSSWMPCSSDRRALWVILWIFRPWSRRPRFDFKELRYRIHCTSHVISCCVFTRHYRLADVKWRPELQHGPLAVCELEEQQYDDIWLLQLDRKVLCLANDR